MTSDQAGAVRRKLRPHGSRAGWLLTSLLVAGMMEVAMAGAQEQARPRPDSADVVSIDGIMAAAYEAVSAEPGAERDLDRFRSLFRSDARLLSVSRREGKTQIASLSLDDFARAFAGAVADGVFEKEIFRRTERFGNIAQVWSTYEIRTTRESPQVRTRGINSLELVYDDERWWITGGQFQNEGPDLPLPELYGGDR